MKAMTKVYVRRIKDGTITNINEVGKTWRQEVIEVITKDSYIIEPDGTIRHIDE